MTKKTYMYKYNGGEMDISVDKKQVSKELELRRKIEEFYLPKQLVQAIVEAGGIYMKSNEAMVAIGFLDIARYTFLSQFLSPLENQRVLNGLYSAFNWVIRKHGGYLNKIEGDSLMFHYGGPIDPSIKKLDELDSLKYIARELFYTCVELQKVSDLFNRTDRGFLREILDRPTVEAITTAYDILGELRKGYLSASFNALFQIRIRVGASMGNALVGNFGPDGAKQWDVIGMPVIEAKRMEVSAPIGGLRITTAYFRILDENGITKEYHNRIRSEAEELNGVYKNIKFDELFRKTSILLKDKNDSELGTYSVQINPSLPESIVSQSELLLRRGMTGADEIVSFVKYYRGNHFVINQLESFFNLHKVQIRKTALYKLMVPRKYKQLLEACDNDVGKVDELINSSLTLFELLLILGKLQDAVKRKIVTKPSDARELDEFDNWMGETQKVVQRRYSVNRSINAQANYFYNVVFPLFFSSIKASILEYQCLDELEVQEV